MDKVIEEVIQNYVCWNRFSTCTVNRTPANVERVYDLKHVACVG